MSPFAGQFELALGKAQHINFSRKDTSEDTFSDKIHER